MCETKEIFSSLVYNIIKSIVEKTGTDSMNEFIKFHKITMTKMTIVIVTRIFDDDDHHHNNNSFI